MSVVISLCSREYGPMVVGRVLAAAKDNISAALHDLDVRGNEFSEQVSFRFILIVYPCWKSRNSLDISRFF